MTEIREELWQIVRSIPVGRCASYGACGRALSRPASGWMVGRWMAACPDDVPWWRVVAKDGRLPVYRRDPAFAAEQERRLAAEGVQVEGGLVDMSRYVWEPV